MFNFKSNKNKGFTLIELMIVISIVALLSSIILASIKTARDRAIATKFKSEIYQFINALELYGANNNGRYPHDGRGDYYQYQVKNNNDIVLGVTGLTPLETLMSPYLQSLPKVPANNFTTSGNSWAYRANRVVGLGVANTLYRCVGDVTIPKYVLLFSNQNQTTFDIFSNLPDLETIQVPANAPTLQSGPVTPQTHSRCYSPK